jgi:hypothetical protein
MSIRRMSVWGLPSLFLLIVGVVLIVVNLGRSHNGEAAFTIGLLVIGAGALLYGMSESQLTGDTADTSTRGSQPSPKSYDQKSTAVRRMATGRRPEWLPAGVIAGFTGTTILTIGLMLSYEIARIIGTNNSSASFFENWLWSLTHNPATDTARVNLPIALILNFGAGILFGIVYAGWIEPRLSGAGWRRGATFAILPWLFSILVFLPLMDGGFLGVKLHAGPLPVIGNLLLNLAYGVTLGAVYAVEQWQTESGRPEDGERRMLDRSQRASVIGIAFGMVCGGLAGQIWASTLSPGQDPLLVAVVAAIIGTFIGYMLGTYAGLTPEADHS